MRKAGSLFERLILAPWALVLLVGLFIGAPVLALGELSARDTVERLRAEQLQQAQDTAHSAAAILQLSLNGLREQLTAVSQGERLRTLAAQAGAIELESLLHESRAAMEPDVASLTVSDARGAVVASVGPVVGSAGQTRGGQTSSVFPRGSTPSFRAIIGGERGHFGLEREPTGALQLIVAVPIHAVGGDQRLVGALFAGLHPERIGAWLLPMTTPLGGTPALGDLNVIAENGQLIARASARSGGGASGRDLSQDPVVQAVLSGTHEPGYGPDPSGAGPRLMASSAISGIPWKVLAIVPSRPAVLIDLQNVLLEQQATRVALVALLLLATVAFAGTAARSRRRRDALAESLEQQTATADVLKVISRSALDLPAVLHTVVAAAGRLCDADFGWLNQAEENVQDLPVPRPEWYTGRWSRVGAFYGRTEELQREADAAFGRVKPIGDLFPMYRQTATSLAILDRKVINVPDFTLEPELRASGFAKAMRARALLAVPLLREGEAIGAIALARLTTRPFTERDVSLVQTFADQAVIAIENVRLFNEIKEKSAQLEAASRHKSEFLANMSHELRTPLNAIIGFSEVLLARMFGELNERQREYLEDIRSSGQHQLTLINEVLDLSKVEAGRMELELASFELSSAIAEALALVRERASRQGISISAEVPAGLGPIEADERKVKQVLLNLLANAVKFTPAGGWVGVIARRQDGEVQVSVRDTGIGIAAEDQARVFEEFQQLGRGPERAREGTGLGLALSRRFVELHGGRIWLESEPGKGSTFTFALPVRAATREAAPA